MSERTQSKLEPRFPDTLSIGALCHQQQQAQYPVFLVTDLEDNIIFGNQQGNSYWKLTKARTNINRYWQASTAFFQCTIALTDLSQLTPLWPAPEFRHTVDGSSSSTSTGLTPAPSTGSASQTPPISQKVREEIEKINEEWDRRVVRANVTSEQIDTINKEIMNRLSPEAKAYGESLPQIEPYVNLTFLGKLEEALILAPKENSNASQSVQQAQQAQNASVLDAIVKAFPLGAYDEICIYGGYLDRLRDATKADIHNGRLLRKGVWSVDTVTVSGSTPTGIIITVQCRDRLKYLMDTFGSYNTAEASEFLVDKTKGADAGKRSDVILSLSQRGIGHIGDISIGGRKIEPGTILDVADAPNEEGTGGKVLDGFDAYFMYKGNNLIVSQTTATQTDGGGVSVTPGESSFFGLDNPESRAKAQEALDQFKKESQAQAGANTSNAEIQKANERVQKLQTPEEFVDFLKTDGAQALGTNGQTTTTAASAGVLVGGVTNQPVSKEMKFNIVTGRVPYTTSGDQYFGQNFVVADRVPLDYIKFISQQEPWPTEVFQDSRTGEFWYAPRGLDLTGLSDKARFFRTYYFRNWPNDLAQQSKDLAEAKETAASLDATLPELETYSSIIAKIEQAKTEIEKQANNLKTLFGDDEVDKNAYFLSLSNILGTLKENAYPNDKLNPLIEIYKSLVNPETSVYINQAPTIISLLEEIKKKYENDAEYAQQKVDESVNKVNEAKAVIASTPDFKLSYPHPAQMIHTFREEVSSISVRTNIIVQSHSPGKPEAIQQILHLSVEPWFMKGRAYPCSFFTVTDDSANSAGGGGRKGALIALALAYARVISKELRVAAATVLGDPSFVPGEVIQVLGSPMNPDSLDPDSPYYWTTDRANIIDMNRQYEIIGKELSKLASTDQEDYTPSSEVNVIGNPTDKPTKINVDVTGENVTSDLAQANANKEAGTNFISFKREPPSMWRVEGVVDRFMDGVPGYYTELALLSCF